MYAVNLKKVESKSLLDFLSVSQCSSGCTYDVMLGYFPAAESFFLGVEDDKYFTGGFISVGNTGRLCSTLFDDVIYRECCTILRGIQACPT